MKIDQSAQIFSFVVDVRGAFGRSLGLSEGIAERLSGCARLNVKDENEFVDSVIATSEPFSEWVAAIIAELKSDPDAQQDLFLLNKIHRWQYNAIALKNLARLEWNQQRGTVH